MFFIHYNLFVCLLVKEILLKLIILLKTIILLKKLMYFLEDLKSF